MAKVLSYSKTGAKQETGATLNKDIFATEVNQQLVGEAYRAYLANGRTNNAKTLKRGEVRGGGRKPWKQKGTGRARFGSIRVPIWRGGGITFGPTGHENYTIDMPIKAKRAALRQALSIKTEAKAVIVLDEFAATGKTKDAAALIAKLSVTGKILLVLESKAGHADQATRNLEGVKTISATYLNVFDVMNADTIIIEKAALKTIESWLGKEEAK
jgi:large subunit ribosomal protein L4